MEPLVWTEQMRKISDLKPYPDNPRRISKEQFEKLKDRIKRLGYHNRIKINLDNMMSGGHQKYKALQQLGWQELQVLVPNRMLNDREFKEVVISDNLHSGEFDFDILANHFDPAELVEWGMPETYFDVVSDDVQVEPEAKAESLPGNICATCPYKEGNYEEK